MSFTPTGSSNSMRAPANLSQTFERASPDLSLSLKPAPIKPAPIKPAPLKPAPSHPAPHHPAPHHPEPREAAPKSHLIIPPRPLPSTEPRPAASPVRDIAKVAGLVAVFLVAAVVAYLAFSG